MEWAYWHESSGRTNFWFKIGCCYLPRYPRWINRVYSWLLIGNQPAMWSDCKICGRLYGTHETAYEGFFDKFSNTGCSGTSVCWRCGTQARIRSDKNEVEARE